MSTKNLYPAFRLNLEQQKKRAKEMLKLAKTGDQKSIKLFQRYCPNPKADWKLADAQHTLACDLRFKNWAELKQHVLRMDQQRELLDEKKILDADLQTMHIRCGHDIQQTLKDAGFQGEFNLHINPYLEGPVTNDSNWLELRAHSMVDNYNHYQDKPLEYESVLKGCQEEEQRLQQACTYERVGLWFEHDRMDQFILLRSLAFFAEHGAPPLMELVTTNEYPGTLPFIGLGQLPPEALALLWEKRQKLNQQHLLLAEKLWQDFRSSDPQALCRFIKQPCELLPFMPAAIKRHLQELPDCETGLSLTQNLMLQLLVERAEKRPVNLNRLVSIMIYQKDPLPGLGDISHDRILRELAAEPLQLVTIHKADDSDKWHADTAEITERGKNVLSGELNLMDIVVNERWVGGVRIAPDQPNWYWDEEDERTVHKKRH
ncbi:MAG: hypothetical protein HOI43_17965 [Gammaproteobacteria bacterium]|jgi:hypothetical protein|nr:hypothetical protein [Gammaproteobacteria bacterium]